MPTTLNVSRLGPLGATGLFAFAAVVGWLGVVWGIGVALPDENPAIAYAVGVIPGLVAAVCVTITASLPLSWPLRLALLVVTNPSVVAFAMAGVFMVIGLIGWFLVPWLALTGGVVVLAAAPLTKVGVVYALVSVVATESLLRWRRSRSNG